MSIGVCVCVRDGDESVRGGLWLDKARRAYKHPGSGGRLFARQEEQRFAGGFVGTLEKTGRHLSTSDLEELLHSILSDRTVELEHLRHNWLDALDVFAEISP